jgi:hypothetical protein
MKKHFGGTRKEFGYAVSSTQANDQAFTWENERKWFDDYKPLEKHSGDLFATDVVSRLFRVRDAEWKRKSSISDTLMDTDYLVAVEEMQCFEPDKFAEWKRLLIEMVEDFQEWEYLERSSALRPMVIRVLGNVERLLEWCE